MTAIWGCWCSPSLVRRAMVCHSGRPVASDAAGERSLRSSVASSYALAANIIAVERGGAVARYVEEQRAEVSLLKLRWREADKAESLLGLLIQRACVAAGRRGRNRPGALTRCGKCLVVLAQLQRYWLAPQVASRSPDAPLDRYSVARLSAPGSGSATREAAV